VHERRSDVEGDHADPQVTDSSTDFSFMPRHRAESRAYRRAMEARTAHRTRLVVMASGNGSNLQAILDACAGGELDADVVAVVSDKDTAYALKRAAEAGVPSVHIGRHADEPRADYDARLADIVAGFAPDLVVLAGWMRILTTSFLGWFPERVVNLHPALPGELPGTHAIERAWHQALAGERKRTGVMVHLVPDEGVDAGPVLATAEVAILGDDTLESLEARIHAVEHQLLVATIRTLCEQLRKAATT
jgi:formyltetrahydrofolate-dependent phosphoribosylglycinamide formyltransferase